MNDAIVKSTMENFDKDVLKSDIPVAVLFILKAVLFVTLLCPYLRGRLKNTANT